LLKDFSRACDDAVIAFDEAMVGPATQIAKRLRKAGRSVTLIVSKAGAFSKASETADRAGARRAVIIFPDEWARGNVKVKDLEGQRREMKALLEKNEKDATEFKEVKESAEFKGKEVPLESIFS